MYEVMGRVHASIYHEVSRLRARLRSEGGQGTVEYVGLLLLIGGLMAVVGGTVTNSSIKDTIIDKLKSAIDNPGGG